MIAEVRKRLSYQPSFREGSKEKLVVLISLVNKSFKKCLLMMLA